MSKPFSEDLSRFLTELKAKHDVSDIDAATRLLWCAATLYIKNEAQEGRRPTPHDFAKFSRAAYMLMLEAAEKALRPS